jgi:AAA family ATP:ADP antiporter
MLVLPIPIIFYLARLKITDLNNEHVHADLSHLKISGNLFSGYKLFFTNPYLLTIGAFLFLYTVISSFIYFEQKNLLEIYDRETRTQILGSIDGLVNFLTFALAFFATSRIVKKLGVGITLAFMPMLVVIGALILAFAPLLTVLLALQVVRRAGEYAVTKPAREMLYTEVSKEERFKSKPIIDVVVYRGGDMFSANLFATLTERLGLGFTAVGVIGAGIAAVWGGIGLYLGRMYEKKVPQTVVTDTGMEKLPT